MLTVDEIVQRIRETDESAIIGLDPDAIRQVQDVWQVDHLPDRYLAFLSCMGMRAGRLLVGTDAFFPRILELPRYIAEFFDDNEGGIPLPEGALIFAMHQGYQVYWFSDRLAADPEVVLYMERNKEPMRVWSSFTGFLNSEYEASYGSFR